MIEKYVAESKNKEDAIQKLVTFSELPEDELFISFEETESKILKSKKTIATAYRKIDILRYLRELIQDFAKISQLDIKSEINLKEDYYSLLLFSEQSNVLIGKEGKNLDALQMFLKHALNNQTGMNIKINLDISNYKAKKQKYFEQDIKNIIKQVLNDHEEVLLDPMNSYERRIIHNMVSEYLNLESLSTGEGKERRVTIKYVEKK
jgi:spoIIIJ-associated protein